MNPRNLLTRNKETKSGYVIYDRKLSRRERLSLATASCIYFAGRVIMWLIWAAVTISCGRGIYLILKSGVHTGDDWAGLVMMAAFICGVNAPLYLWAKDQLGRR